MFPSALERSSAAALVTLCVFALSCGGESHADGAASGASLLHLADVLADARVESAPAPARQARAWSFAEPRPEWRVISGADHPGLAKIELAQRGDCVHLALAEPEVRRGPLVGGLAVDVDGGAREGWAGALVRARSHERLAGISVAANVDGGDVVPRGFSFFMGAEGTSPVFNDGSVQDYLLPLVELPRHGNGPSAAGPDSDEPEPESAPDDGTLKSLGLFVGAPQPAGIDILSVELVPRGADFAESSGVRSLTRDSTTMRTLFAHAPAKLAWQVDVPPEGRLDLALTCLPGERITYQVMIDASRGRGLEAAVIALDETIDDAGAWKQYSVDLSRMAGSKIEISLIARSEAPGAVALWGAPILSGSASASDRAKRPNVILYVIDGGGADLMSLYGYNRRTTPFLERLAAEGVVFERAHSNSTWTQPSTASFMTSLQHSVLGGLRRGVHSTPVPAGAVTMAEHMRAGGYETAVFTSNPNAARVIGLERGVDVMRDVEDGSHSTSSTDLHARYWRFRADYPGTPYWVHFQTTDVHEPNEPEPPFSGLFISMEERAKLDEWDGKLFQAAGDVFGTTSISGFYDIALERAQISRQAYFNARRSLYDETMAHQDEELRRFVERLKAEGEWEDTLLVIAADHGHPAGTFARFGRGLFDPQPEPWQGALFDSYATRVPLVFVWPRKIRGGRRIEQPVSMIDVLPTILELAGLPEPEVHQGRSLAPLLLGRELAPRPVILDEFRVDEATGEMIGNLEMIDGRWGASLEIGPVPKGADPERGRHAVPAGGRWGAVHPFFPDVPRLLLYDLWNDPFALRAVNGEHPDLVERYQRELSEHWRVHETLAQRYGEAGDQAMTPELVEQLRALGYVR